MGEKPLKTGSGEVVVLSVGEISRRIDDFVREYLSDKSPATVGTYRRSLNELLRWISIRRRPLAFTVEGVEEYKRYLSESKGLHDVSISTYLTALRRFCQYLVDIGMLEVNPARAVKGNRRPSTHSRQVLTTDEVDALKRTIKPSTQIAKRDLAIVYLMLHSGLSEIEIVRSDVGDLEQTLMGWFLRVQGKGRTVKDQQVPVDIEVVTRIQDYLSTRRVHPEAPLFVSHGHRSDGERLNTRSIRTRINEHLSRAGVKRSGISPHSLTHTAALIWLKNGMDLEEVQSRMRHGTLETTMISFKKQGLLGPAD
ncbi:MAG: site-specific integrase [Rhodothermales bacterium]|nr:site-specific integrase [Rhodothermales bacterium]